MSLVVRARGTSGFGRAWPDETDRWFGADRVGDCADDLTKYEDAKTTARSEYRTRYSSNAPASLDEAVWNEKPCQFPALVSILDRYAPSVGTGVAPEQVKTLLEYYRTRYGVAPSDRVLDLIRDLVSGGFSIPSAQNEIRSDPQMRPRAGEQPGREALRLLGLPTPEEENAAKQQAVAAAAAAGNAGSGTLAAAKKLPAWVLPVGIGAAVIVVGGILFAAFGGRKASS